MADQNRTVDERIARIASASSGVVTWAQLRRAGVTHNEISRRARRGTLIRVHRGVYRVGHAAPSTEATYLAAVKACGEGAVLHDRAAAYHLVLLPPKCMPPGSKVMCPTERSVPGVLTRRSRRIHPLDVTTHAGIPVTTVPRTLLDLAAGSDDDEFLWACHQAWVRWRTGPQEVRRVLERHANATGAGRLRGVVLGETRVTLSRLEGVFLSLLTKHGIEPPETNRSAGGKYVDCRWRGRLTVELVSYAFHASNWAWERDHERRRDARAREEEFRVYTWTDVTQRASETANEVRSILAAARPA